MTIVRIAGALLATLLVVVACERAPESPPWDRSIPGGDPVRGAAAVRARACGACHEIPGIRGARGRVGPPLAGFADRPFIAGAVPNTAGHLVAWLRDPPAVQPRTAMPTLGLRDGEAQDIAAFLYTLRARGEWISRRPWLGP